MYTNKDTPHALCKFQFCGSIERPLSLYAITKNICWTSSLRCTPHDGRYIRVTIFLIQGSRPSYSMPLTKHLLDSGEKFLDLKYVYVHHEAFVNIRHYLNILLSIFLNIYVFPSLLSFSMCDCKHEISDVLHFKYHNLVK